MIIGDLENKETLNKIPLEIGCVIHCAGNAKFGNIRSGHLRRIRHRGGFGILLRS